MNNPISQIQSQIQAHKASIAQLEAELELELANFYPDHKATPFDPESVIHVLQGNARYLLSAFRWESTPQGEEYWSERDSSGRELSAKDRDLLFGWLLNWCRAHK